MEDERDESKADRPAYDAGEVASWHRLSGMPENVTDDGEIVETAAGRRAQAEKDGLRAAIARLSRPEMPTQVRGTARLAASYLLAGDVETANRYVTRAQELAARGSRTIEDQAHGEES